MPNTMKNSKNYSQVTQTTYLDIFFRVHCLFQAFSEFLVWYPSCACALTKKLTYV